MTINDHLALSAERRAEIENHLMSIAFSGEEISRRETERALFDLSSHVKALDERIANYARIFDRLGNAADSLAADDVNLQARGLGLALQQLLASVVAPTDEGN